MRIPWTDKILPYLAAFACGAFLATLVTNLRFIHMRDEFHRNLSCTLTLATLQNALLETEVNPQAYLQELTSDYLQAVPGLDPEDLPELMKQPALIRVTLADAIGRSTRDQRKGIERGHPTAKLYNRLVHLLSALQVRYIEAMDDSSGSMGEPAGRPLPSAPARAPGSPWKGLTGKRLENIASQNVSLAL